MKTISYTHALITLGLADGFSNQYLDEALLLVWEQGLTHGITSLKDIPSYMTSIN